jgi:ketosteroid isomerase-like protein
MSRENVEIVRRFYKLLPGSLVDGAGLELCDPEIEWLPVQQSLLGANSYRGHSGLRRFWEDLLSAWEEYRVEPQELLDLGDQVVVVHLIRARSKRGLEVAETWSALFTLGDGMIVRCRNFTDRGGALKAARARKHG